MELSKRLRAVAGLVTEGASVADVGTDHGYMPIYLITTGTARKAIASDIMQDRLKEPGYIFRRAACPGRLRRGVRTG